MARLLWHDELFTLWAARLPPAELFDALRYDSGPPLFYLAEKPFVLFAEAVRTDPLARLLPFLAALLLFFGVQALPRGGSRGWFLALAAASPLLLVYAAEARAYEPLALLDLLLFWLLFVGEATPRRLIATGLVAALALWTHYLALFFLAAAVLVLLARRSWKRLAAVAAGGLLFLPWVPVLLAQPKDATTWMHEPLGPFLVSLLAALGGSGRIPNPLGGPLPAPLLWAGAAVGLALLVAATLRASRDRVCADAIILVLLTMGLVLVASLSRPVAFPGRSEMAILPVWFFAFARTAPDRGWTRLAGGLAILLACVSSLLLLARPMARPVTSQVVAEVVRAARAQDQVLAAGSFYLPARLAHDRGQLASPVTAFPLELARHPGWIPATFPEEADYQAVEATLAHLPPGGRAFLLLHPILRTPRLSRLLADRGQIRVLIDRPDALLLLYAPQATKTVRCLKNPECVDMALMILATAHTKKVFSRWPEATCRSEGGNAPRA